MCNKRNASLRRGIPSFHFFESENNKYETSYIKITVLMTTTVLQGRPLTVV